MTDMPQMVGALLNGMGGGAAAAIAAIELMGFRQLPVPRRASDHTGVWAADWDAVALSGSLVCRAGSWTAALEQAAFLPAQQLINAVLFFATLV